MALKSPLEEYENNWQTDIGAWFPGESAFLRGKSIFTELNNHSWIAYIVFGVTGRQLPELAAWIEGFWVIGGSFPDPRLWNNRIAALAGTARSTGALGIAGAVAVSEAKIFGGQPIKGSLDFLYRLAEAVEDGEEIEAFIRAELKHRRSVPGYGRPVVKEDERIAPLLEFTTAQGLHNGRYLKLAFAVNNYLSNTRFGYRMNVVGFGAAIAAEFKVTPAQWHLINTICFTAGFFPCYADAGDKPEGALFPLKTDIIRYTGAQERTWGGDYV